MNDANIGSELTAITLLAMQDILATGDGTGVDCRGFVGSMAVTLMSKNVAGTTPTLIVKLQDSDDDSSYADIPGAVFTTVTEAGTKAATSEKITLNIDAARRYVRAVKTLGGTSSPQFLVACTAVGVTQYR